MDLVTFVRDLLVRKNPLAAISSGIPTRGYSMADCMALVWGGEANSIPHTGMGTSGIPPAYSMLVVYQGFHTSMVYTVRPGQPPLP